jgi:predicted RNA-binding protein Jag
MSEKVEETAVEETEKVDLVDFGSKWLEEVFGKFGLSLEVKGEEAGGDLSFDIHGGDADKFIEGLGLPPGKLISATQTVLATALQRQGWGRGELVLDVRGLQKRRSEGLGKALFTADHKSLDSTGGMRVSLRMAYPIAYFCVQARAVSS